MKRILIYCLLSFGWLIALPLSISKLQLLAKQTNDYAIKIIPTYFGQKKDARDWFVYRQKPGDNLKINLTAVNLAKDDINGQLCLVSVESVDDSQVFLTQTSSIFASACQPQPVSLAKGQRQDFQIQLKLPDDLADKEYPGYLVIFNQDEILGLSDARIVVGDNLETKFSLSNLHLNKTKQGLEFKLEITNQGKVSLSGLKLKIKSKNAWWPAAADETVFVVGRTLYPGKKIQITRLLPYPPGLAGPIKVGVLAVAGKLEQAASAEVFWWSMARLISLLVYIGLFALGIVLSFKLIFKGAAGIIYNYLKSRLVFSRRWQPSGNETDDDIKSLIKSPAALDNQTYNQLLMDLRHIVREEMDLNRRLIKAELNQDAATMVMNLIKQGVLKLDVDPKVKDKLKVQKSKKKGSKPKLKPKASGKDRRV